MAARPFAPPPRDMGCSGSRSDLVKPQELLTEASEDQSPLKPFTAAPSEPEPDILLPGTEPGQTPGAASEPVIELLKDAKDGPSEDPAEPVMATATTKEDLAVEDPAVTELETAKAQACPEPDLSWFDSATSGDLGNLQRHLQRVGRDEARKAALLDSETEERKTALHLTAEAGHLAACQWLLEAKADALAVTKKKATALHLAASAGHLALLQLLLEAPEAPGVLALDLWRCSPLHRAAELGRDEVACYLLQRKADCQKADREGNTPLHFACSSGCAGLAKELLKRQVPLDFTNNDGFSPLDLCVRKKQAEVGDLLVSSGAKLVKDVRKTPPTLGQAAQSGLPFFCSYLLKSDARVAKKELAALDSEGRSPLLLAIHLGHRAVVERLLEHPLCSDDLQKLLQPLGLAPIHQAARSGQLEIMEDLLQRKAQIDQVDAQGSSCLFHAAEAAQLPMLQRLLRDDATLRPELCDDRERTALHSAAWAGSVRACEMLLEKAEEKMELMKCQDWEGATAVHLGIKGGHADVCKYLLEEKADLQQPLDFGVTPLQLAADLGHQQVLQLLLEDLNGHGAALQRALQGRSGDGRGAWLVACANGHLKCAQTLRSFAEAQGIDVVKEEDRTKRRAMMLAAKGGHLEMCKWLLETGSDVKERDSCQWTPLHAASAEGHSELVEWLLKQGADVSAVDEDGHTAHSLARRRGAGAVESLLRRYAAKSAGA